MFDGRQRGSLSAVTKGSDMIRKALSVLVPAGMTLLIASMWTDIVRYWKIKQLSLRGGHPQNVPASGRTLYPQRPGSRGGLTAPEISTQLAEEARRRSRDVARFCVGRD
jgi:hypothetical protein